MESNLTITASGPILPKPSFSRSIEVGPISLLFLIQKAATLGHQKPSPS